jgi:hypothetical protein
MKMTQMNIRSNLIAVILGLLAGGCSNNPVIPTDTQIVLKGYLYAGQPVQNIQLTASISIASTDTADPPISNASVVLMKGGTSYALIPTPAQLGFYHYPGNNLSVATGDDFTIQVDYNGQRVMAETIVPSQPQQVTLSTKTMRFRQDTVESRFGTRLSVVGLDTSVVTWSNPNADYFYIVIESIDSSRQLLRNDSLFTRRFVSNPSNEASYTINNNLILYTGKQILRLYHVNKEYANLYLSRQQDSYSLNEPLSNVHNGLGIFSAFASDSLYFSVVLE